MKRTLVILYIWLLAYSLSAVVYCPTAAFGYGAAATGGGSATPTLVSSIEQLKSALNKGTNKVIIITQSLTFTEMLSVQDGSNVTLMALPGVTLTSLQQDASSSGILYVKRFNNLIIRNITFIGPGAYDCDGNDLLCFEKVTNAWVDHCDFQDGCDGNFDNKSTTDNVTVSWCRFRYLKEPKAGGSGGADDHRFTNLLGSSSSDKPSDGTYNFTWAYCWWDEGCKERMVRCRNASLHFLNCYWNSSVANYYIGPENVDCYIEGCTFEGNPAKSKIFYQNYNGTNGAKFVNCMATKGVPSNVTNRTVLTPSYSYTALSAADAKEAVRNTTCGAGATLIVTTAGNVYSSCDNGSITTYTVTWDATTNGGTCSVATSIVESGATIGALPTATRSGYTFKGWFTTATGGTQITASTTITADVTYYAQFTEQSGGDEPVADGDITWNFSTDDFNSLGTLTAPTTVNGLSITATADKTVVIDESNKTIGNITFTHRLKTGGTGNASYRNLSFSVTGACTIEVYCSSATSSTERTINVYSDTYGGTLLTTLPAATTPAKQVYEYTGDATTILMGSANSGVNFYGINLIYPEEQQITTFTLSYDDNGGDGAMSDDTGTTVTVQSNTFTAPEGYAFKEWNTSGNGAGTTYQAGATITLTADLTLYAIWQPLNYTITLDLQEGTNGTTSITATYDAPMPAITIPSREGYSFLGFFTEPNGAGTQYYDANGTSANNWTIPANTTLYAAWIEAEDISSDECGLHFWFFNAADATTNGLTNDATVFSNMVAAASSKSGSIVIDGITYTITKRTGDTQTFGQFVVPEGKTAVFYALAISSGNGDRQINLTRTIDNEIYIFDVAGGTDDYKRIESDTLSAGTYTINREGTSNVRLGIVAVKLCDKEEGFDPDTYTITWKNYDGTVLEVDHDVEEGTMPEYNGSTPVKPAEAHYFYTFIGWTPEVVVVSADAVYTATFTGVVNTHKLSWDAAGGTLSGNYTSGDAIAYGTVIIAPNATREGYNFSGWNPAFTEGMTMPDNDLSFIATWTEKSNIPYTVNHYQEALDGSWELADTDNLTGTTGTNTAAAAKLYVGFTAQAFSQAAIAANGSTVVDIYYTRNSYTLTYRVDGEAEVVRTYEYQAQVEPYTPAEKEGYTFSGWDSEEPSVMPAENLVLNGNYVANIYTVTWLNADGIVLDQQQAAYGESVPEYAGETPTKADDDNYTYEFTGWQLTEGEAGDIVKGDMTFTATYSATEKTPTGIESVIISGNSISGPSSMRIYDYTGKDVTAAKNNLNKGVYIIVIESQMSADAKTESRKVMIP